MSCTVSLTSTHSKRSGRSKKKKNSTAQCIGNQTKSIAKLSSQRCSEDEADDDIGTDCNEEFTPSGCNPAKTVGPLGKRYDHFAKYAPCGHWSTCKEDCGEEKYFEACELCPSKGETKFSLPGICFKLWKCFAAPFGPYGPWSKKGPATFISPRADYIKKVFPKNKICKISDGNAQPMGDLGPWPLSGSCRYAGRPYGPCRPFGAFKSRGPFGAWSCKEWPEYLRPNTPRQPCWKPTKGGRRPCTPCHRPLFRPCKPSYNALIP